MVLPEIARLAASWWADILREGVTPSVERDAAWGEGNGAVFTDFMISLAVSRATPLTLEAIQKFEDKLTEIISTSNYCTWIDVDYHPCRFLTDAVEQCGIDHEKTRALIRFPFKTSMMLDDEEVTVARGYGAERVPLFMTKRRAIRREVVSRVWDYQEPWRKEKDEIITPLVVERQRASNAKGHFHPDVAAIQQRIIAALKPFDDRDEHWRNTFDEIFAELPLVPPGKFEDIVNDVWSTLVIADKHFVFMREEEQKKTQTG